MYLPGSYVCKHIVDTHHIKLVNIESVHTNILLLFRRGGLGRRGCHCRVREQRGQIKIECCAVGTSLSMHEMCSMQQICCLTPPCHSTATVIASNTHSVLNIPSVKAKVCLETLNVLLGNPCIFHCLEKCCPGGRLATLAFHPFGETSLHCCLLV